MMDRMSDPSEGPDRSPTASTWFLKLFNWPLLLLFAFHAAFWHIFGVQLAFVPCKVWNVSDYYVLMLGVLALFWLILSIAAAEHAMLRRLLMPIALAAVLATAGFYMFIPHDLPDQLCPGYEQWPSLRA